MDEQNKNVEEQTEVKTEPAQPTVEELAKQIEELNKTNEKYKKLLDKANSEAADNKRKLRDKMSEDERVANDTAEKQKAMEAELAALRKDKTVSDYTARLLASGFDSTTAQSTASALADGDMETVFANLTTLTDSISKSALAKAMDNQGGLSKGTTPTSADLEKAETNKLRAAMGLPLL